MRYWLGAGIGVGMIASAFIGLGPAKADESCLTPEAVIYGVGPVAKAIVATGPTQGAPYLAKHLADTLDAKWSGVVAILAFIGDTTATVYGFDPKGCEVIDQSMAIADYDAARVAIGLPPYAHLIAPAKPPPPDKSI